MWKRVRHRNIVPFHGATFYPRQLVLDWMEDGNLREFLEEYPKANRLGLVRVIPLHLQDFRMLNRSLVKRRR